MSYILLAKPGKGKEISCRVIKSETMKYGWKNHETKGFGYLDTFPDWESSQLALRKTKALDSLPSIQLLPLRGCWKYLVEPEARPTTVRWRVPQKTGHFVYSLKYEDDLVYIGVTSNPPRRKKEHWKSGKLFDSMEVLYQFDDRAEAEAFETFAINSLTPPLNRLYLTGSNEFRFGPHHLNKFAGSG